MEVDWECGDAKNQNQRMNFRIQDTRYIVSQDAALISSCVLHLNSSIMDLIQSLEYIDEVESGQEDA